MCCLQWNKNILLTLEEIKHAYFLSWHELADQMGVSKSIISQFKKILGKLVVPQSNIQDMDVLLQLEIIAI